MSIEDDITQRVDPLQTQETSRHLAIGALADKFYKEASTLQRKMIDSFLPAELTDLLKR